MVTHQHESTIKKLDQKKVQRVRERNQLLFIWKNLTSKNLMRRHWFFLLKRVLGHPGYLRILLMALVKYGKVRELREREIKRTKVSDEMIFSRFS